MATPIINFQRRKRARAATWEKPKEVPLSSIKAGPPLTSSSGKQSSTFCSTARSSTCSTAGMAKNARTGRAPAMATLTWETYMLMVISGEVGMTEHYVARSLFGNLEAQAFLSHPRPKGLVSVVEVKDKRQCQHNWSHVLTCEYLREENTFVMKSLNFLLTALIYFVLRPKCFSTVERTAEMYFGEQWLIMLVNQSATKASQPERCQCLKIILVNHLNATKACQPTKYVLQVIIWKSVRHYPPN